LRQAIGPLFLVREQNHAPLNKVEAAPFRRILVALRGYSSDEQTLEWAAILATATDATLTILPLTGERVAALEGFCIENNEPKGQFHTRPRPPCDERHTCVRVRQGTPVTQIAEEIATGDYDLLIVAAEGEGAFVGQVLAELERRGVHSTRPVLVLKPTL
jgi:hypothetical protein